MADANRRDDQQASLAEIAEFIREVSAHMREAGLASVEIKSKGAKVKLRFPSGTPDSSNTEHSTPHAERPSPPAVDQDGGSQTEPHYLLAPMIGTFYAASAPGEAPFVRTGDRIEVGQTVGIIEAMKILNEITADQSGIVEEILVKNAEPVEYGQRLLRIAPDGA